MYGRYSRIYKGATRLGRIVQGGVTLWQAPSEASSAPVMSQAGSISPASGVVGTVFTLVPPVAAGIPAPTVSLTGLTQGGVDVLAQVSAEQFTSTATGALVATWSAMNGVAPNATGSASATVTAVDVPAPPSFSIQPSLGGLAFEVGDIISLDLGSTSAPATLNIETFTLDGTDISSELSGLSWNSTGRSGGTLALQVRATSAGGTVLSSIITAPLIAQTAWIITEGHNAILISAMPAPPNPAAPVASGGINRITISG